MISHRGLATKYLEQETVGPSLSLDVFHHCDSTTMTFRFDKYLFFVRAMNSNAGRKLYGKQIKIGAGGC